MLKKLINSALGSTAVSKHEDRLNTLRQGLIRHEAKIGGQVFGPVPKNHSRDFFCLDRHTWVWHEEWTDDDGGQHLVNTRYDVREGVVLKSQNGGQYHKASPSEVRRLAKAAEIYEERVNREIYNFA